MGQVEGYAEPAAGPPIPGPPIALAETCRVVDCEIPLWRYHRRRLLSGGCTAVLLDRVERAVAEAVAGYDGERTSRVRLHLEVAPNGSVRVEVARALSSLDVIGGPVLVPVRLAELPPMPPLPPGGAKPADRSWWDTAARAARRRGAHQALIVDDEGSVVDGSSASVWIAIGARLLTPPSPPAIEGVMRTMVLERAEAHGLEVAVEPMRIEDIEAADEVLLTNAFGGAVPVRGRGGRVTTAVRALVASAFGASDRRARTRP